ncbi:MULTISPECIES: hypothetical protein [unclassified Inquilinus]|uniref:hypothetical protein n=1 Tax=unclassified Inquilinus TaxID=2645927 RepID=UPI003F90F581
MTKARSAPAKAAPTDQEWTDWELGHLRELAELSMQMVRMVAQQQEAAIAATPAAADTGSASPDFMLMFTRGARAVRLTLAMVEKVRDAHRARAAEAQAVRDRRWRRRRLVERVATVAIDLTDNGGAQAPIKAMRDRLQEQLRESERLDAELDAASPHELFVRIFRHLRLMPGPGRWPQTWREGADPAKDGDDYQPKGTPPSWKPPARWIPRQDWMSEADHALMRDEVDTS